MIESIEALLLISKVIVSEIHNIISFLEDEYI